MEIETRMVPNDLARRDTSEDVHIDLLWSWSDFDLTLTWGQILKLTFQFKKVHVSNRLEKANTMVSLLFSYLSYQKVIMKDYLRENGNLCDDFWKQSYWP